MAALLVIGIIGIAGGLRTAPAGPAPAGLPRAPINAAYNIGPATATLQRVVAFKDLGGVGPTLQDDKDRFLGVVVTMAVTDSETWGDADRAIELQGVAGLAQADPDSVLLVRDAQRPDGLQPGLPEQLVYIWEQRGDVPLPASVTVVVKCQQLIVGQLARVWDESKPCARADVATIDNTAPKTPTPTVTR